MDPTQLNDGDEKFNDDGEKAAHFALLSSLTGYAADDDDEVDAREQRDRHQRLRFFRSAPPSAAPPASKSREVTARKASPSGKVISREAAGRKGRLEAHLVAEPDAMDETVIPDSAPRRSDSNPLPLPLPSKRLLLTDASEELSPSVAARSKRRKRGSDPKLRPAGERIFDGLAFFYIPDNDIAPARRLRIAKAREYGALWARDVSAATHVVVDKNLEYKDVEKFLSSKAGPGHAWKLVNENYPVDCIQFRSLLDHNQNKYQIAGQPAVTEAEDAQAEALASAEKSAESLQLKPKRSDPRRRACEPQDTPPGDEESSQRSLADAVAPAPTDSPPATLDLNQRAASAPAHAAQGKRPFQQAPEDAKDELSGCISMMQEFRHLPLDKEEEDDASSGEREEDESSDSESERSRYYKAKKAWLRAGRKETKFEDRFACNQAGEKDGHAQNPNARTVEVLQSMANYYDRVNDHWRTMGYRKAISTLKRQDTKVCTEEEAFRLPHIGRRIAQKIEEIVTTNRLRRLEYAQGEATDGALQLFLQIYGVGSKQAQQWIAQGYRTLDDVMQNAKLTASQTAGIQHYEDLKTRIPRQEVEALGTVVRQAAARLDPEAEVIIGGSYRRGAESSGDIDVMVTRRGTESCSDLRPLLDGLISQLEADQFLVARLASSRRAAAEGGGSKWHGCCVLPAGRGPHAAGHRGPVWRRIDFLLVPETERGAALLYFTGNDIFNRSMRLLAAKKGMRLNQRGLYRDVLRGPQRSRVSEGQRVEGRDERRIFELLGVRWREPHERWC